MSRIGKLPIKIPAEVIVKLTDRDLTVKGPKGELKQEIHPLVMVSIDEKEIVVSVKDREEKEQKSLWGLFRVLIDNMVIGVTKGFSKQLEINGVGFKFTLQGKKLVLNVGFSHPVDYILPDEINGETKGNLITISGIDKQLVGEVAASIRAIKKPEPYKGKGIKYIDEVIRRKAGKVAKSAG